MRDLVLAKQFKNTPVSFASRDLKGNSNHSILEAGYPLEVLQTNKFKELHKLIKKLQIELIIIDHYDITMAFEKKLKQKNPNLTVMVLDDTYQKHYCDILLNHNIYAKSKKYKNITPKNTIIKCGRKHLLLREEFLNVELKKPKKTTIFIAIGGTDHSNINIKILKTLKKYKNIKVHIVTSSSNENLQELVKYVASRPWIHLHINTKRIAQLMQKSSFAIVSASVVLNEVFSIALPFIAIKTADNQKEMYKYLKKQKKPILKAYSKEKLSKLLKSFIHA